MERGRDGRGERKGWEGREDGMGGGGLERDKNVQGCNKINHN